jgi:hypothetical protein
MAAEEAAKKVTNTFGSVAKGTGKFAWWGLKYGGATLLVTSAIGALATPAGAATAGFFGHSIDGFSAMGDFATTVLDSADIGITMGGEQIVGDKVVETTVDAGANAALDSGASSATSTFGDAAAETATETLVDAQQEATSSVAVDAATQQSLEDNAVENFAPAFTPPGQ